MRDILVVRLVYCNLHTVTYYDQNCVANPSLLKPEMFRSEEQLDQLVDMAQRLINKGNWHPSHAMIDKSQAEYNALRNGKLCSTKVGNLSKPDFFSLDGH